MKAFVGVVALLAVVAADVSHLGHNPEQDAQILRQDSDISVDQFQYAYETSNGISAQESGQLVGRAPGEQAIVVQGQFAYNSPEGQPISLQYTADENGYQPQGAHLPTPPPTQEIPPAIVRALKYIADHPPPPENPKPRGF